MNEPSTSEMKESNVFSLFPQVEESLKNNDYLTSVTTLSKNKLHYEAAYKQSYV